MKINHKYLRAILAMASDDELRYALNGVHIEPVKDGNLVVATDGRRLAVYFCYGVAEPAPFILPKWVMAFVPAMIQQLEITVKGKEGKINAIHPYKMPTILFEPIEGTYPKWRQVVPKGEFKPTHVTLDARILEPFLTCAKVFSPEFPALYLRGTGNEFETISVFIKNDAFYGIVMPMYKADMQNPKLPAWAILQDESANSTPKVQQ